MLHADIRPIGGVPTIHVNGVPIAEMAYITYRTDHNRYADFAAAGVRLFSVNLNFSEMPINESAPVLVFQRGIFEHDTPDFSIVEQNIGEILAACPDAYIFPRVNVNLSEAWENSHPDELCDRGYGERRRASFASDAWAEEVRRELTALVTYMEAAPWADHIIGYQIAGGNTDEWFPLNHDGFRCARAAEKFALWCAENGAPQDDDHYYLFASELTARRILEFAALVKSLTDHHKLTGAFYGYTLGAPAPDRCHHALALLLESDALDFLCAPPVYIHGRAPGLDLYPPLPVDSLRLHGKMYLSENDIRTHLSRFIHEHPNYQKPIWLGPDRAKSAEMLKHGFSRAMLHGYGMWWFDMWGGWFDDPAYMALMEKMTAVCAGGMDCPQSEIAVFTDERSMAKSHGYMNGVLRSLGISGVPYDAYLASDFAAVADRYKAYIFLESRQSPLMNECIRRALAGGRALKILRPRDTDVTFTEWREFFRRAGVTAHTSRPAAIARGERYIMLYTAEDGVYDFTADGETEFHDLFTGETVRFPREMKKDVCMLFERKKK